MCGRYARFIATQEAYTYFKVPDPAPQEVTGIHPSWNVAPQTMQPVIVLNPITGRREFVLMRWGLVPFFSRAPTHSYSTINARAEDILQKAMFRDPDQPPVDLLLPFPDDLVKAGGSSPMSATRARTAPT